jgi:quercetin dioxygenase-like cupin family protein
MDCPITTYGRLREWRIYTRRQGDAPNAETGEVCFEINTYGRAVVIPGVTTEPAAYPEESYCVFTASGQGLVLVGNKKVALQAGSSMFFPPGVRHQFRNTGDAELEFIFCRRPSNSTDPKTFGCQHWSEDRPAKGDWGKPFQGHWHHIYRGPAVGIGNGDIPPHKFSHPHNHPIIDEIWYVNKGQGWHWTRQEYHVQSPGYALWLDPSELHSLMNPTDENLEYIYCASTIELTRQQAQQQPYKAPSSPGAIGAALEEKFGALVAAYRHTGIGINGVEQQIGDIEKLIKGLRK